MKLADVLHFISELRTRDPDASKQHVAAATQRAFGLTRCRSVYVGEGFAIRFSAASGPSFSNVVLSLSALRNHDNVPFIVVIARPDTTEFLLANSTFLKKISHSSHQLRLDNVRGSFLGHDILRQYEGIDNCPENFDELFALHEEFTWDENLERLVDATSQISGTGRRFSPTPIQQEAILRSPSLAASLLADTEYLHLKQELAGIVSEQSALILEHGLIDNVNQRGNSIEQAITGGINAHGLADMVRQLSGRVGVHLEIKTKLMDRASSPKAYNIDKALEILSRGNAVIAICFVGINLAAKRVTASTVSIFDRSVLDATRIQFHWAGRNSRGVTQLTGNFSRVFDPEYTESIDEVAAGRFLRRLLEL